MLLDANHGAGSMLGRRLLDELGCQVTILGGQPDGQFEHVPEPTAENLAGVLAAVPREACHVGFCQDPDADRLAIIDEQGRYLGEEYTLAIAVDHVLRQQARPDRHQLLDQPHGGGPGGKIRRAVHPFGWSAKPTSSTPCWPEPPCSAARGTAASSIRASDWSATASWAWRWCSTPWPPASAKVSELADELPRYEIVKTKITLDRQTIPAALAAVERHFADAQADRLDGLRLDWPDKWLLVRAQQHRADRPRHCRSPHPGRSRALCRAAQAAMSTA